MTRPLAASRLDGLFTARVRFGVAAALADTRAAVVFRIPEAGTWTLVLHDGRVSLRRGSSRHAAATITADADTMCAILDGDISGVEAFLDGRLTMRGDISLALRVDGAFDVGRRPAEHPRAHTVDVEGVPTFYLEAGPAAAPPVILLHGLGATNASMLPLLPGLARDYRVLAPDMPGFGASGAPAWSYCPAELTRWLRGFCAATGAGRVAVVGNSLGGRVAIEYALAHPQDVANLVLLCPSPAFRRMRQFVPLVRLVSPELGRLPIWLSQGLTVRGIRLLFSRPDRLAPAWYEAAADEFRRVMAQPGHRRAFLAALCQIYVEPAFGSRGFWERLPGLEVPALFVWGARDRLVPARFARHVAAALPDAGWRVLEDCGHVPQFELADETLALTRAFVGQAAHSRQII